jgi:phospholipid/cholesterol/gamma-HCH transport system substrate-binding protein
MRPGQHRLLPAWAVGIGVAILFAIGAYVAFFKDNLPFSHGFEIKAVFSTSEGLRETAEVRISGITVGRVTDVELLAPDQQAAYASTDPGATDPDALAPLAIATMEIDSDGLPLKQDATFELRPRLFLEGNLFVDLRPGSPAAPEVSEGHVFGPAQTATSVKLDRILTTLQGGVRSALQDTLAGLGGALVRHGGAEGLNDFYATSPGAFRYTAQLNQALLGTTPDDLASLSSNFGLVARAFDRNETALKGLVSNLDEVTGALAADDESLRLAVAELPGTLAVAEPALTRLNAALPSLRALAREARPGVEQAPQALAAGTPLLRQLRLLASKPEARGLIGDLAPAVPQLASLTKRTKTFLEQGRLLSSCFNHVVVPWANSKVSADPSYPFQGIDPVYKETAFGLVGANGESRSGDANGQYVKAFAAGGTNAVVFPPTAERAQQFVGLTAAPLLGATPSLASSEKPPYRPDVPCETQEPPDLDAGASGPAPSQQQLAATAPLDLANPVGDGMRMLRSKIDPLGKAAALWAAGDKGRARELRKDVIRSIERGREHSGGSLVRSIEQLGSLTDPAGGTP